MAKQPKLGSGKRFKALANKMAREGMENPEAAAAAIGNRRYGIAKMHKMAMHGKEKKSRHHVE